MGLALFYVHLRSTGQGVAWWLNGVLAGIRGQTPQAAPSPHHQRLDARTFRFPNPLHSCHIVSCGIRLCMARTSYNCAFDWLLSSKIRLIRFFGCTKQYCVSGISGFLGRFGDWVDAPLSSSSSWDSSSPSSSSSMSSSDNQNQMLMTARQRIAFQPHLPHRQSMPLIMIVS